MDVNQHTPVSDDQELANVLAGMNQHATSSEPVTEPATDPAADSGLTVIDPPVEESAPLGTPELQFEETSLTPVDPTEDANQTVTELPPVEPSAVDTPVTQEPTASEPSVTPSLSSNTPSELDDIKKDALEELRPLVSKLELPADEKFDTLLLVIRSTDDKTLVNAAFDAAKGITDETKRAQALLDVIKEIDYFSGTGENPAA